MDLTGSVFSGRLSLLADDDETTVFVFADTNVVVSDDCDCTFELLY